MGYGLGHAVHYMKLILTNQGWVKCGSNYDSLNGQEHGRFADKQNLKIPLLATQWPGTWQVRRQTKIEKVSVFL
jgi:hypothetical protein